MLLMELEDVPEEMAMSEAERIAYEMRGGENGGLGGFGDEEDMDFGDEELYADLTAHVVPNQTVPTSGVPAGASMAPVSVQEAILPGPAGVNMPQPTNIDASLTNSAVYQQQQQQQQHQPAAPLPNLYLQQQQQLAIQQQQQLVQHRQAMSIATNFPGNFVSTFDQI